MNRAPVAITWEEHRRMRGVCRELGLPLVEMITRKRGLRRYGVLGWQLFMHLWRTRPRLVLVQNPSLVLALLVTGPLRWLFGFRVIVDAHNEAVTPFVNPQPSVLRAANRVLRAADITLVSNDELGKLVSKAGGRPFTLPDPMPEVPPEALSASIPRGDTLQVAVISTFAPDEPLKEIVAAAREVGPEFQFRVSGNSKKASPELRASLPSNVVLTGFLSELDYWRLLLSSHLVLDLTSMPNCLVCGSYEALAAGRPMLLTEDPAARQLFAQTAVYCANEPNAIARALREARSSYTQMCANVPRHQEEFRTSWAARRQDLLERIRSLAAAT